MRSFVRLRVENPPDLAALGPIILAPNHVSYLDPPVLQAAVRHHLTFMMTELIYRHRLARWFFRLWEAIPVPDGRNAKGAIKGALEALERSRPLVIFPEGRISSDGQLNEGRGGVVMLVLKAGVPVIPVSILGTFEILPRHRRWPRRGIVTVRFGAPMSPPAHPEAVDPKAFAAEIMERIADLGAPRRPAE